MTLPLEFPRWARAARRSGFLSNVFTLFSWVVVAQGVNTLVMPFLTRLYHPEQFGIYSLFTNVTVVLGVVAALRYEFAVVLPDNDSDAARVMRLGIGLAIATAGLTLVVGSVISNVAPTASSATRLRPWLIWLAASVATTAAYSLLMYWALRRKAFFPLALSRAIIAIVMATTQLLVALIAGPRTVGLIAAMVVGQLAGVIYLGSRTGVPYRAVLRAGPVRDVAIRYSNFPKYSAVGSLIDAVCWLVPVATLASLYSPAVAGLYAVADKTVRMPSALFGSSLQQVFYQRITEFRSDPDACRKLLLRTWALLLAAGAIPMLALFLFGPQLFTFVFGARWHEAGVFARLLAFGLLMHFVSYPTANGIVAFERQRVLMLWQFVFLLVIVGVFGIGGILLRLPAQRLVLTFSVGLGLVQAIGLAAQWRVMARHTPSRASATGSAETVA